MPRRTCVNLCSSLQGLDKVVDINPFLFSSEYNSEFFWNCYDLKKKNYITHNTGSLHLVLRRVRSPGRVPCLPLEILFLEQTLRERK